MVDSIGIKAKAVVDRPVATVAASEATAPVRSVSSEASETQVVQTRISQELAAQPPVDSERVARIRKAVQDGNFPLIPSTVADRLLALKLEWSPNDKA
jgi:negative regulator of flagellin synthesis FlgM